MEGLEQGIGLLAQLTTWAVFQASTDTAAAIQVPTAFLAILRSSVQASLRGAAQGVLQSRPCQLLLWLLEAENKVGHCATLTICSHCLHSDQTRSHGEHDCFGVRSTTGHRMYCHSLLQMGLTAALR